MTRTLVTCMVMVTTMVLPPSCSKRDQRSTVVALAVPLNPAPADAPGQPLPYSHQWHVGSLHMECTTCHTNPEPGNQMTFPATAVCMSCHASIATDRPAIQKLAEYAKSGQPIPWVRVYTLLPGVTWTHRKHLRAGVQCQSCHGSVADLPAMRQMTAVTSMASCIGCHQTRQVSTQCATCHAWPEPGSLPWPWSLPGGFPLPERRHASPPHILGLLAPSPRWP
jgi:hypothetical protein